MKPVLPGETLRLMRWWRTEGLAGTEPVYLAARGWYAGPMRGEAIRVLPIHPGDEEAGPYRPFDPRWTEMLLRLRALTGPTTPARTIEGFPGLWIVTWAPTGREEEPPVVMRREEKPPRDEDEFSDEAEPKPRFRGPPVPASELVGAPDPPKDILHHGHGKAWQRGYSACTRSVDANPYAGNKATKAYWNAWNRGHADCVKAGERARLSCAFPGRS